jgi:hypothetical protein
MSFTVPMRQTTWDGVLRLVLLVGALFDLAFGVAVFVAWQAVLKLMGLDPPAGAEVYVKLAALLSLGLGVAYAMGAIAPWRYHANINIAAAVRFASAAFFAWSVYVKMLPFPLVAMAAGELVLGTLHFFYSRRTAAAAAGPQ